MTFKALWDTGATASVITAKVVAACGFAQLGVMRVSTANGLADMPWYLANIKLMNQVGFPMLKVTRGDLHDDIDVLIGMDIIARGDFAISHPGGSTVFTFRYPSCASYDFVKEHTDAHGPRPPRQPTPGQSFFGGKRKR